MNTVSIRLLEIDIDSDFGNVFIGDVYVYIFTFHIINLFILNFCAFPLVEAVVLVVVQTRRLPSNLWSRRGTYDRVVSYIVR